MQYICIFGCKIPPVDGYVAVCLDLTIEAYGTTHFNKIFLKYCSNLIVG